MAGVAQTRIYRRFAWQAWHLWYWVAPLGPALAPVTPRHFAWQAWHNLTSTFVSRGRRGTNSHPPSFCVAGVALMVLGGALGPGFGACDAAPLCVAGVAQPDIHLRFTWQAWHKLASTVFHTSHCHTPSFTHHLSHTTLSHTIFDAPLCHTPLCHTPSFTHHLPHTTLSHAIFHTPSQTIFSHHLSHTIFHTTLCLAPSFTTPSFTHHFVTHHLSPHHLSHTQLCRTPSFTTPSFTHTTLSHTIFHHTIFNTTLSHTIFRQTILRTPLCHTHYLSSSHTSFHIQLCHTQLCFTSRSSTTSFVFPSFPVPATTFGVFYSKKLSCGVIRSFNCSAWDCNLVALELLGLGLWLHATI